MKTERIKVFVFIALLILGIFSLFYGAIESILDAHYLRKDSAYTISNRISLGAVGKGSGSNKKYTFFLKRKWYAGSTNLSLHTDGTKYFIKFYPLNPNRNKATEIIATPEDIKNLPPDGYKELPHQ